MININVLYFQILELKNADTENVLLHFTFPIKILFFFIHAKFDASIKDLQYGSFISRYF